jgi:hypothetical protein
MMARAISNLQFFRQEKTSKEGNFFSSFVLGPLTNKMISACVQNREKPVMKGMP